MNLIELFNTYYPIVSTVVSTAAMLAAITPTPKDNEVLGYLRKGLDFLAFNFGNARNEVPNKNEKKEDTREVVQMVKRDR